MYTQCPDCQTAFRVTAPVLQQAAGRVRCGGCGSAFNALDYLSEELPPEREASPATNPSSDHDLQKKLLETLDQLAGPENIVIEDTGAEWQVLDETAADESAGQEDSGDTTSTRWVIEKVDNVGAGPEALPEIIDEVPLAPDPAVDVMRFDDNTPLPEDFDEVVAVTPSPQRRHDDKVEHERAHFDELQFDLALGNVEEWVNLLDEVEDRDATDRSGLSLEVEEELAAIHSELTSLPQSRNAAAPAPSVAADIDDEDTGAGEPAAIGETEDISDTDDDEPVTLAGKSLESTGEFEEQIEIARAALLGAESGDAGDDDTDAQPEPLSLAEDPIDTADAAIGRDDDDGNDDDIAELVLRGELDEALVPETGSVDRSPATTDNEREQPSEPAAEPSTGKSKYPDHLFDENADNVETIIMEGEFVHASLREHELATKNEIAGKVGEAAFLADTYSINRDKIRGRRKSDPAGSGVIAAVIVLALLLVGQLMHNMRQTLATVGAFNQTIAPIYRLLGSPVTPEWDIKGWQFQTTRGGVDESGQLLTIYSTVVNRSARPLPYPLVHVSLTDRWEEIVGSRVLEPNEYLAGDLDRGRPVAAGEKFTAVISISSPSSDATGFKLNVCYRVSPGQVRCATEDFRE